MPTKRRRTTRGRTVLTPMSFHLGEILDFIVGWSPLGSRGEPWADKPGAKERQRWPTWHDFLADWAAVRDQWEEELGTQRDDTFAEWLYQKYGLEGPPDTPVRRSEEYPAVIPSRPVCEMFRTERDNLKKIRSLKGLRR